MCLFLFLLIPKSLIYWSSQKYSPYHQFDIVYDLLIPRRDQCFVSGGVALECLFIKTRDGMMSTDSLSRRAAV